MNALAHRAPRAAHGRHALRVPRTQRAARVMRTTTARATTLPRPAVVLGVALVGTVSVMCAVHLVANVVA
jgi:hypothetical protein